MEDAVQTVMTQCGLWPDIMIWVRKVLSTLETNRHHILNQIMHQ